MSSPAAARHLGLVGCGKWGRLILRDLKTLGCRVSVAVRSAASVANAYAGGADAVAASIEELPDDIEGAVVATQTSLHAEAIERLLPRGIPVFVEKVLAPDLMAAQRLLAMAPERIFLMDKWRYHPGVEALAAIASSGELGEVRSLITTRYGWGMTHTDVDPVWILTPHDLAIALEILGHIPDPVAACGYSEQGQAVELTGLLGTGPVVTLSVSARHTDHRRMVMLRCSQGSATLEDSYASDIVIRRGADGAARPDDPAENRTTPDGMPLLRELQAFLEHLGGGPPPRSSAGEGVRQVEVITRLRQLAGL
jgi:predicted dehydrogenase